MISTLYSVATEMLWLHQSSIVNNRSVPMHFACCGRGRGTAIFVPVLFLLLSTVRVGLKYWSLLTAETPPWNFCSIDSNSAARAPIG